MLLKQSYLLSLSVLLTVAGTVVSLPLHHSNSNSRCQSDIEARNENAAECAMRLIARSSSSDSSSSSPLKRGLSQSQVKGKEKKKKTVTLSAPPQPADQGSSTLRRLLSRRKSRPPPAPQYSAQNPPEEGATHNLNPNAPAFVFNSQASVSAPVKKGPQLHAPQLVFNNQPSVSAPLKDGPLPPVPPPHARVPLTPSGGAGQRLLRAQAYPRPLPNPPTVPSHDAPSGSSGKQLLLTQPLYPCLICSETGQPKFRDTEQKLNFHMLRKHPDTLPLQGGQYPPQANGPSQSSSTVQPPIQRVYLTRGDAPPPYGYFK